MTTIRPSARILSSQLAEVGPGQTVRRPLPQPHLRQVGPFIFWDHFGPKHLGPGQTMDVPEHPHAGFQTVTYLFSGRGEHIDSFGGEKVIYPGGVNWMTAGRGILHEEVIGPEDKEAGGEFEGLQIWVNLPAAEKHRPAGFVAFAAEELPAVDLPDGAGTLRVIGGEYGGHASPVETFSPLFLYHLELSNGYSVELPAPEQFEVGIYTVRGEAMAGQQRLPGNHLAVYPTQAGAIKITARADATIMIFGGEPLNEPMTSYGPFVMNTPEQIREVIHAYQAGKFGQLQR